MNIKSCMRANSSLRWKYEYIFGDTDARINIPDRDFMLKVFIFQQLKTVPDLKWKSKWLMLSVLKQVAFSQQPTVHYSVEFKTLVTGELR